MLWKSANGTEFGREEYGTKLSRLTIRSSADSNGLRLTVRNGCSNELIQLTVWNSGKGSEFKNIQNIQNINNVVKKQHKTLIMVSSFLFEIWVFEKFESIKHWIVGNMFCILGVFCIINCHS